MDVLFKPWKGNRQQAFIAIQNFPIKIIQKQRKFFFRLCERLSASSLPLIEARIHSHVILTIRYVSFTLYSYMNILLFPIIFSFLFFFCFSYLQYTWVIFPFWFPFDHSFKPSGFHSSRNKFKNRSIKSIYGRIRRYGMIFCVR